MIHKLAFVIAAASGENYVQAEKHWHLFSHQQQIAFV